jgi:hypothetical protein
MTEKTQPEPTEIADAELDSAVGGAAAPGGTLGLGAGDDPFGFKPKTKAPGTPGLIMGDDPFG